MTDQADLEDAGLDHPLALVGRDKASARVLALARRERLFLQHPDAGVALSSAAPLGVVRAEACVISAYWPMGSEMDPRPLMLRLAEAGADLCLPRLLEGPARAPLRFHRWTPAEPLQQGPFGLMQPRPEAPGAVPDLLLVPLLAFDESGSRLGYGGGYYDRTLAALRARKTVVAVGVAYAGQEADHVPVNDHDQALDAVLTEKGWRPVGPRIPLGKAPDAACDTEAE